jgi:putative salt-induced outer membrane protein YdiY
VFVGENKSIAEMIRKFFFAIFLVACFVECSFAAANSKTNSLVVVTNKPPSWDGFVSAGLTATAGNSDSVLATSKVQAHLKMPRDEWTLGADGAYGETESVKNSETLHGFGQYNHLFIDNSWYGYARADALHDGIANVEYRIMFSPGVGYYFIKTKQVSLAGECGPGIETEKLDGSRHTYPTARLADRFEYKIDDRARIWETAEFLPPLNKLSAFLFNAEVGVEAPLTRKLSLQVYVDDNFANEPAPGLKDNDVKLVSGLTYKF